MDKELLGKAVDALVIQGVFLHSAEIKCKEGVDLPFIDAELSLTPQHRGGPIGHKMLEVKPKPGMEMHTVTFHFGAGTRLIESSIAATVDPAEVSSESVFFEITAEFTAQYNLRREIDEAEFDAVIKEFGQHNVAYHVWPFWREYVQSTCCRMGIPPIPVPFYLVPGSEQSGDEPAK